MHNAPHSLRLIAMSAVALAACQRPAPAPPSVAAHPAAGTYRLKVVRGAVDFPAKNPLEAVLVLNQGRLPASVARQLTATYFTRADERTALGEACIRWEIPLWSNRPAFALRHRCVRKPASPSR